MNGRFVIERGIAVLPGRPRACGRTASCCRAARVDVVVRSGVDRQIVQLLAVVSRPATCPSIFLRHCLGSLD